MHPLLVLIANIKFAFLCLVFNLQVRDIPCGTKGGVMTNFEKIEVSVFE